MTQQEYRSPSQRLSKGRSMSLPKIFARNLRSLQNNAPPGKNIDVNCLNVNSCSLSASPSSQINMACNGNKQDLPIPFPLHAECNDSWSSSKLNKFKSMFNHNRSKSSGTTDASTSEKVRISVNPGRRYIQSCYKVPLSVSQMSIVLQVAHLYPMRRYAPHLMRSQVALLRTRSYLPLTCPQTRHPSTLLAPQVI